MGPSNHSSTSTLLERLKIKNLSSTFRTLHRKRGRYSTRSTSKPEPKEVKESQPYATLPSSSTSNISPPQRDWEGAFASLQSAYGASGQAPCLPRPPSKAKSDSKQNSSHLKPPSISEKSPEEKYGLGWGRTIPIHNRGL